MEENWTTPMSQEDYDAKWHAFYEHVEEYVNHDPSRWNRYTLLAYFVYKFKKVKGIDFMFAPCKKGPTETKEMKLVAKIWTMFEARGRHVKLQTEDDKREFHKQLVMLLKEYVDWIFDVKMRGKEVTSVGLFAHEKIANEFMAWRTARKKALPRRADPIPKEFLLWIQNNHPTMLTKHTLAVLENLNALLSYTEYHKLTGEHEEIVVLNMARQIGIMPAQGKIELGKK